MTTVHAQLVGDQALVSREELEQLVDLARRTEEVDLRLSEDDLPTLGTMRLAEEGGSFAYWMEPGEDVYTLTDGEPV